MAAQFLGKALRGIRAGESRLSWNNPALDAPEMITLTSPAFEAGGPIPRRYAGRGVGENVSPPLRWDGVPATATEMVLIVEDIDAPLPRPFVHCIAYGVPADLDGLPEGALSGTSPDPRVGTARGYLGPRPISGHGSHRYVFQIFALDRTAGLLAKASVKEFAAAASGHVVARGRLDGRYELP